MDVQLLGLRRNHIESLIKEDRRIDAQQSLETVVQFLENSEIEVEPWSAIRDVCQYLNNDSDQQIGDKKVFSAVFAFWDRFDMAGRELCAEILAIYLQSHDEAQKNVKKCLTTRKRKRLLRHPKLKTLISRPPVLTYEWPEIWPPIKNTDYNQKILNWMKSKTGSSYNPFEVWRAEWEGKCLEKNFVYPESYPNLRVRHPFWLTGPTGSGRSGISFMLTNDLVHIPGILALRLHLQKAPESKKNWLHVFASALSETLGYILPHEPGAFLDIFDHSEQQVFAHLLHWQIGSTCDIEQ